MFIPLLINLALLPDSSDSAILPINIFPLPNSVVRQNGNFRFDKQTIIETTDGDCAKEAVFLQAILSPGLGDIKVYSTTGEAKRVVLLQIDKTKTDLGPEGYTLQVAPNQITLQAAAPAGIFYGIQTIRQLLPSQIENPEQAKHARWDIPCVEIADKPKFAWRGLMLDVSRHFFPKQDVEHFLDLEAMHKMNMFHWHLVDDGGWRIQINHYPKLTDVGGWRTWTTSWDQRKLSFPGTSSGDRVYGGFYTQADIKEVVHYAADRHITVVPEIEMPGHSMAALAAYPELLCTNVDVAAFKKKSSYSPNVYCAGKESTFKFLENVIDEVCTLFPGEYFHIGGDEVNKSLWDNCPDCKKRMEEEGLKTPQELQSYFVKRIESYLNSKGKRLIGWDEILEGGLAPNAAVMSWRGIDGGIAAAQAGHNVVMSPGSHCYFDHSYADLPTEKVITFDPVPPNLADDQKKLVLGAQGNLWTERVPDVTTAEQRILPRMLALSEALWSEKKDDPDTFMARLRPYYARLDAMGCNYYLPKPEAEFDAVLLNGPSEVRFMPSPIKDSVIRYTTDGGLPTPTSPEARNGVSVDKPCVITAAIFRPGGAFSEPIRVDVGAYKPTDSDNLVGGLGYKIFDGSFEVVPDFDALKPAASGEGNSIGLVGDLKVNYAIEYSGYIRIDKEGTYTFTTTSDDGSVLWLGNVKVVDSDGPHGAVEKRGRIYLKSGVYPIKIGYFQGGGDQELSATVEGPGLSKQPIPATMLFRNP